MRNTGETDVYGLSIPVGIELTLGATTHHYITGDGYHILVKDEGKETVIVSASLPDQTAVMEEHEDVVREEVADLVKALFSRYRH